MPSTLLGTILPISWCWLKKERESPAQPQPYLEPRCSCRRPSITWFNGSTYTITSHRINPSVSGLGCSCIPRTTPWSWQVQFFNKLQAILKWWNIQLPKPPSSPPPGWQFLSSHPSHLFNRSQCPWVRGCGQKSSINTALKPANGRAEGIGSAQPGGGSGVTWLQPFRTRNLKRGCLQGCAVIEQGGTDPNWKRIDLNELSGGNSSLWGWWGPGTRCPGKLWLPHPWQCSSHAGWGLQQPGLPEGVPAHRNSLEWGNL